MSNNSRSKNKFFITLNLKLAIVVVIALIMAILVFEVLEWVETFVIQKYYLSETAMDRNVNEAYDDLTDYVEAHNTKSTDIEQLQQWIKTTSTHIWWYRTTIPYPLMEDGA